MAYNLGCSEKTFSNTPFVGIFLKKKIGLSVTTKQQSSRVEGNFSKVIKHHDLQQTSTSCCITDKCPVDSNLLQRLGWEPQWMTWGCAYLNTSSKLGPWKMAFLSGSFLFMIHVKFPRRFPPPLFANPYCDSHNKNPFTFTFRYPKVAGGLHNIQHKHPCLSSNLFHWGCLSPVLPFKQEKP